MSREDLIRWSTGLGLVLVIWLFGWITRRFLLKGLQKLARFTSTDLDEMLLDAVRPHVPWWFFVLGMVVAAHYVAPTHHLMRVVDRVGLAAFLLSLTLAMSDFLTRLISSRAREFPGALPTTTLTQNLIRIAVVALGLLLILGNLGIQITPILTALGVGSLAVALALQPTLSNLFAGFNMTLAKGVRIGDYVELENNVSGYVVDIGWRSTQIRELSNNIIIVPNAKLAELVVKNYALPEAEQSVLVQVGVSYNSDLEHVERVTIETAREVLRSVQGGATTFEPFIRYHTFGDSSIDFTVILRVQTFVDRFLVTHEFVKRLHRRYAETGIEIPFPQRVVHFPAGAPERS